MPYRLTSKGYKLKKTIYLFVLLNTIFYEILFHSPCTEKSKPRRKQTATSILIGNIITIQGTGNVSKYIMNREINNKTKRFYSSCV